MGRSYHILPTVLCDIIPQTWVYEGSSYHGGLGPAIRLSKLGSIGVCLKEGVGASPPPLPPSLPPFPFFPPFFFLLLSFDPQLLPLRTTTPTFSLSYIQMLARWGACGYAAFSVDACGKKREFEPISTPVRGLCHAQTAPDLLTSALETGSGGTTGCF